jgi:hypothetical protein
VYWYVLAKRTQSAVRARSSGSSSAQASSVEAGKQDIATFWVETSVVIILSLMTFLSLLE